MGQFKPMVKMMTTEPSVELKLKKGGKVAKKADGGMMGSPMSADMPPSMPARGGLPMAGAPMKPSLAMRRRAMRGMPAGAGPAGPVGTAASMPAPGGMPAMKKGGKAKHEDAAQDRAMIKKALAGKKFATGGAIPSETTSGSPATTIMHQAKADSAKGTGGVKDGNAGGYKKGGMTKKMATGGIVKGQAGYATGGVIPSRSTSGSPATTIVDTAKYDNSPANTGGVKMGNAGGYKKGGSAKKAYAAGGTVDSGRPVAMPQGRKPASKPVRINELAGTYKTGGKVTPAEGRLQKMSASENAPAFRAAKADSNLKYGPASKMKLKEGGDVDLSKGAYDKTGKVNRDLEEALNPLSMVKELAGKAKNFFMPKGSDSVTKTKESVTVTPGRKRGGSVNC